MSSSDTRGSSGVTVVDDAGETEEPKPGSFRRSCNTREWRARRRRRRQKREVV